MTMMAARSGATQSHSRMERSGRPCVAALRIGPKNTRWTSQSMYTAPRMTPVDPMTESRTPFETDPRSGSDQVPIGATKVPRRMRNSPMNPLVPGRPIDESVTTTNTAASAGVTLASPPYAARSRVCVRS